MAKVLRRDTFTIQGHNVVVATIEGAVSGFITTVDNPAADAMHSRLAVTEEEAYENHVEGTRIVREIQEKWGE